MKTKEKDQDVKKNRFNEKPIVETIEIELDRAIFDGCTQDFEEGEKW